MNDQITREISVHGKQWNTLHEGYFSNPAVASPLVEKVMELVGENKPDVIVDLGGGVGFLLSQLIEKGIRADTTLINLDDSASQLNAVSEGRITSVRGSVESFLRDSLSRPDHRFLYMMRSVLHYFGENGLRSALRQIRSQMNPGEFFIHQTASFQKTADAQAMNALYKLMHSDKWYPTVDFLKETLAKEGWQLNGILPAEPLRLTQQDLKERYRLSSQDVRSIQDYLTCSPMVSNEIFEQSPDGFIAYLHYWIYVCQAV